MAIDWRQTTLDWRQTTLGELTENFDSVRVPVKEADRRAGPYPYYGASGIVDYVDDYLFEGNYLLIAEDGENLRTRKTPVAFLARGRFWVNNHAHVVRASSSADTRYLMYALAYADVSGYLSGSTLPKLTQGSLNRIQLLAPPADEQRAIAHILGTLDDKIELNRRTNETLEAIAGALFKSWFVNFDPVRAKAQGRDPGLPPHLADLFPESFEDSELGEIPTGWGTLRLGDLLVLDKGLSYKGEFLGETGIPMVNLGCFLGHGRFGELAMKHYSGEFRDRHVVRPRDLVVANTDLTQKREVIGSPALIPPRESLDELLFTHHVFAARFAAGKEPWKLFVYFSLLQEEFRERATGFATGTTVLALPRDAVLDLLSAAPPTALIGAFDSIVLPLIERQWKAAEESRTLTALRDTLLPNLISGELDVSRSREGGLSVRVDGSRRERQGVG
jgi:type I restriction enzyme S subunit